MHPILKSTKYLLILGLQWSPFCFAIILLHSKLLVTPYALSTVFLLPPLIFELFICISLWWVCKNLPLAQGKIVTVMAIHHFAATIVVAAWILLSYIYCRFLMNYLPKTDWHGIFFRSLPLMIALGVFLYIISCFFYYVTVTFEKNQQAEKNVIEQKLHASLMELKTLKSSINPHFLFNSLTALDELIRKSPEDASKMCVSMSEFLRHAVKHFEEELIYLEDELNHITNYLNIEKIRLGDRLLVNMKIGKNTRKVHVPPLILLPIVENAVKHGISQLINGGRIDIVTRRIGTGRLEIEVKNPREESSKKILGESKGLEILRRRINLYYGSDALLILTKDEKSFTVRIIVPAV
jgi:hypothetical protein